MIVHFYSDYSAAEPDTAERQRVAHVTWAGQLWRNLPLKDNALPRLWNEEGRRYPYVLDLFDMAVRDREPDTILVYTNSDVCVRTDAALIVAEVMQDTEAFYSFRRDFNHDFHEPIADAELVKGDAYVGSDFYAFRSRWWIGNRADFPDLIVAHEGWDAVLRRLIEITNASKTVCVSDLSYHRRHASVWERPENRHRLRGQLHNIKLCSDWMRAHGVNPMTHGLHT